MSALPPLSKRPRNTCSFASTKRATDAMRSSGPCSSLKSAVQQLKGQMARLLEDPLRPPLTPEWSGILFRAAEISSGAWVSWRIRSDTRMYSRAASDSLRRAPLAAILQFPPSMLRYRFVLKNEPTEESVASYPFSVRGMLD